MYSILDESSNFTSITQEVVRWDKDGQFTRFLMALVTLGVTVNPECWLKLPIMVGT